MKNETRSTRENSAPETTPSPELSIQEYDASLDTFDCAVCDAIAVSQATANKQVQGHIAYSTYIFTCLCNHAVAMIRAAPRSRWSKSDFDHWALSGVAGHARAILEGQLLFNYLIEQPTSDGEWSAKLNVMHINDCTRRIKLLTNSGAPNETIASFLETAEVLRNRLRNNPYFTSLPRSTQTRCLAGDFLTIQSRDDLIAMSGQEKGGFNMMFDLLSQHTHILPLSFYRMEPNGRGTGVENNTDRSYIAETMKMCAEILRKATDKMIKAFPGAQKVRRGKNSKFSPGPRENLP